MGSTSKRVLKVMGIFTGVEMLGILCSMIRGKLLALWLGEVGIGLMNIFNTTVDTTTALTGLGLRQSSVPDISAASHSGQHSKLLEVIRRVRSWSLFSGILGASVLGALCVPLSHWVFNDPGMWWSFLLLGLCMLLNALYAGESAVFQGTEEFRRLARTGVETAVVGLLLSVPLYRWMGNPGVVVSLVVYSVVGVVFVMINRNRSFEYKRPELQYLRQSNRFVKFGAYMAVTGFLSMMCNMIFTVWLNRHASTAEVGLYAAGMMIVVRYTSLVFSSVSLEYYPRISGVLDHPMRVDVFMSHEIVFLMMLFTPMMLIFMIFRTLVVELLYTREFLVIIPYITWGIMTIILRGASNTMAYTIMAKGEGKVYMAIEVMDAVLTLGVQIWLYTQLGLVGIGIGMVLCYGIYLLVVESVCRRRYGIRLRPKGRRVLCLSVLTGGLTLIAVNYVPNFIWMPVAAIIALVYIRNFGILLTRRRKS